MHTGRKHGEYVDIDGVRDATGLVAAGQVLCILRKKARPRCLGYTEMMAIDPADLEPFRELAMSDDGSLVCVLDKAGGVRCYEDEDTLFGRLGEEGYSTMTVGAYFVCGLRKKSGEVVCGGSWRYGELGTGDTPIFATPVRVLGLP